MIRVVCGIIMRDAKVLICRRNPNKLHGGYWEFPGGKIEIGESPEDSLTRELDEELGMKVKIGPYFKTINHEYEKFVIELIAYRCEFLEASFKMTDHDLYQWIKIAELSEWRLSPADIPLAKALVNII